MYSKKILKKIIFPLTYMHNKVKIIMETEKERGFISVRFSERN